MGEQVSLFDDLIFVYTYKEGRPYSVGTYFCYEKANKELITCLTKGMCAWMKFNGRKTESRRLQEIEDRRSRSMETLG